MEKDFRLFVKNLPINIDETKVQDLFTKQHVTVKKVDLKEKKNLDNKLQKFAFVNVTTTDKQLHNCFASLNGERLDGFEISVELAKENFLDRLKREREENQLKKESTTTLTPSQEYVKPNLSDSLSSTPKATHKKFSDLEFSPEIHFKDKKSKKRGVEGEECPTQESLDKSDDHNSSGKSESSFESLISFNVESSNVRTPKKKIKFKSYDDEEESTVVEHDIIKTNTNVTKKNRNLNNSQKVSQTPEISESERKRQLSLKEKKNAFKTQEQLIRNALRRFDSNTSKDKIVFDDNIEFENVDNKTIKMKNDIGQKKALFNSDDEDGPEEKIEWNEDELEAKSQTNQKLMKLQSKIGYDERFVLDERFIEDENEEENKEDKKQPEDKEESSSITDEKKWQLDILKDVLGETAKTPKADNKDTVKKQSKMIRYDPTASNHQDFEVNIEKTKKEKRIKKKLEQPVRPEEPVPKVSNEIFFEVGNLAIGNKSEGFSLLKTNDDNRETNGEVRESESSGFKFNFNANGTEDHEIKISKKDRGSIFDNRARNSFKCNSSDDEGDDEKMQENGSTLKSAEFNFVLQQDKSVFFVPNDARFKEAEEFFKTATIEDDDFKNKRRGLKEIVRSKIRNNMKKKVPWNKKKIRKVQKRN